jgi:cytochrome c5
MSRPLLALLATAIAAVACVEVVSGADAVAGSNHLPCARDDLQRVTRPRPGAPATPLVPHGAMLLTICNYNGANATAGTPQYGLLGSYRTRSAKTIRRLTIELDGIKPPPAGAVYNCPAEEGNRAIMYFYYGSAAVVVTVGTDGCNSIDSGPISKLGLGAPVVAQIQSLARPVKLKWPTVVGHVRLCGGPVLRSGRTRCFSADGDVTKVEAINSSNRVAAMAGVRRGRFRFRVASPGRYSFKLTRNAAAKFDVLTRTTATLRAGRTTKVVLTVPVP